MGHDQTADAEPRREGITLDQFAAVCVGVGAGVALEDVLANEGIDPRHWPVAERAWSAWLADDLERDGPLGAVYDECVSRAQPRYARRVEPLASDHDAWLLFLRLLAEAENPLTWLDRLGLRLRDVMHLREQWAAGHAVDDPLDAATQTADDAPLSTLPELTIWEVALSKRAPLADNMVLPFRPETDAASSTTEPSVFELATSAPNPDAGFTLDGGMISPLKMPSATPFAEGAGEEPPQLGGTVVGQLSPLRASAPLPFQLLPATAGPPSSARDASHKRSPDAVVVTPFRPPNTEGGDP